MITILITHIVHRVLNLKLELQILEQFLQGVCQLALGLKLALLPDVQGLGVVQD